MTSPTRRSLSAPMPGATFTCGSTSRSQASATARDGQTESVVSPAECMAAGVAAAAGPGAHAPAAAHDAASTGYPVPLASPPSPRGVVPTSPRSRRRAPAVWLIPRAVLRLRQVTDGRRPGDSRGWSPERLIHRQTYIDLIRAYLADYGTQRDLARALG